MVVTVGRTEEKLGMIYPVADVEPELMRGKEEQEMTDVDPSVRVRTSNRPTVCPVQVILDEGRG